MIALALGVSAGMMAQTLPYQNPNLSAKERAEDLCSRLTLEEKAQLMLDDASLISLSNIVVSYPTTSLLATVCMDATLVKWCALTISMQSPPK